MENSYVEKLYYQLYLDNNSAIYPLHEETDDFRLILDKKTVIFEMKKNCASLQEAKIIAEDYIKKWRIFTNIDGYGLNHPELTFVKADMTDDHASAHLMTTQTEEKITSLTRLSLPQNFFVSPEVESMYLWYKAYQQKYKTVSSMAYMCLAIFELSAGGRRQASKRYKISKSILKKLSMLCVLEVEQVPMTLTPQEENWIVDVVKVLIKRAGEWAYDPSASFEKVTLENLQKSFIK
jgi:hypothetical protein